MKIRLLLIFGICLSLGKNLLGQSFKQFSGDNTEFIKELKLFCQKSLEQQKELAITIQYFSTLWDSSYLNDEEKNKIQSISAYLIERKIRPYPEFSTFIKANNLFFKLNHPRNSYDEWLSGLVSACEQRRTLSSFMKIWQNTLLIFEERLLYKSASIRWKPSDTIFLFRHADPVVVNFKNIDLICYANLDSSIIFKTSGTYNLLTSIWTGKGGIITWERAGYSKDSVYAQLREYFIDMNFSGFQADSVTFVNRIYFSFPLMGKLENSVEHFINLHLLQYPRFESYQKRFTLRNFYKGVDYQGGFAMMGAKLAGRGSREEPATLTFFRNDTLRVKSTSLMYIFYPGRVVSSDASITIYLDQDSIHHSALQFLYRVSNRELSLLKSERYTARSPYLNSYHQIDMNFDQLLWRIDEPKIYFTVAPGSARSLAIFESFNYFKQEDFEKLQYYDEQHPLVMLAKFSRYFNNATTLSAKDFANFIRKSLDNVHTLLFPLAVQGYILYDVSTETIVLKEKLFDALKASTGKIDYDVLRLYSLVEAPMNNAVLDLRNNDLTINGIPRIFVSDSQNVAIVPSRSQIVMKRNRSFQFEGMVQAGLFTYYGKNFFFQYDTFKIVLRQVDSVKVKVIVGYDLAQKPILREVSNTIYDATGEVLVDDPNNKAGLKNFAQYPIFRSYGYSYVYYDDPNIFNGVYKRSRNFYFRMNPYEIDSLDNFKKESMKFAGTFYSANIFPDIEEKLTLQKDFSLGFNHITPTQGLSLFQGKGQFYDTIHLSNQGLRGKGKFTYITSSVSSFDIVFFPDSATSSSALFSIGEETNYTHSYPKVWGRNIRVRWLPYQDDMSIQNTTNQFNIYNDRTFFEGSLSYNPRELWGKGLVDLTLATSKAKRFNFRQNDFSSDTASFNIRVLNSQDWALTTDNVNCKVDMLQRFAHLKSNDPLAITRIPTHQYMAQINEFKWWMDKHELNLLANQTFSPSREGEKYGFKDETLTGARYISTDKVQDSLSFVSPSVLLNYEKRILDASKVKYVDVADARIFPLNERIIVGPEGRMLTLTNAKILANRATRFHQIYNATVNIHGRFSYTGSGKYDYIDENNTKQTITFTDITVDTSRQTIATGAIAEPDSFTLNPFFHFQGDVQLAGARKYLLFDGGARIIQQCPNVAASWIRFSSVIDPLKVRIPVGEKNIDINRNPVVVGPVMAYDSIHLYSLFFARKKYVDDYTMATASGQLWYNKAYNAYEVGQEDKLKRHSLPGPLVSLSPSECIQYAEGPLDLIVRFGQLKTWAAGNITHRLQTNEFTLRTTLAVDFNFYSPSLQRMAKVIDSLASKTDTINIFDTYYKKNFANLIATDSLKLYYQQLTDTAKNKKVILPSLMAKTIFLDDVYFIYDDTTNSFRSVGKIGIGYINGRWIHRKIDGYIEIWRKNSGDWIDIYLQPNSSTFYYFGYEPGKMMALSSDRVFQDPLHVLPERQRRLKVARGEKPYLYTIASDRKVSIVRKRWKLEKWEEVIEEIPQFQDQEIESIEVDNNDKIGNKK
ncbi:MAG: hypothetical protein N2662_02770 [Bacteroidales bacterium]|nr:hypothetical protein [Bacteroidales bacterium]